MAVTTSLISADSHVLEPADLWTRRLPMPYRPRAPRIVESEQTGAIFIGPEIGPVSLRDASSPNTRMTGHRMMLQGLKKGGFDAVARLADCDVDGVEAEILYPTAALKLFGARDADYRRACVTVYNDWVAEFCGDGDGRLFGLALLDVDDPAWAVDELARGHEMGFVGGIVPGAPPEGHYAEERFGGLWRAASERRLPLSIHAFAHDRGSDHFGPSQGRVDVMADIHLLQQTLAVLSATGTLASFPDLRLVASEHDAGWVPHFLQRLDGLADRFRPEEGGLAEPPSAYIRRQVSFGFQDDRAAIALRHEIGVEALLWGSDYPHVASHWPHSRKVLDELLADVPGDDQAAIVGGNAVELYGLPVRAPVRQA